MELHAENRGPEEVAMAAVLRVDQVSEGVQAEPVGAVSGGFMNLRNTLPIADAVPRARAQVSGVVVGMRVREAAWGAALDVRVEDATGELVASFFGRRSIGGVQIGAPLTVEGMVLRRSGGLAMLNPAYDLRPSSVW
jgi:hypothetical protein